MGKGKVLKIYDKKATLENLETGDCLLVSNSKDNSSRVFETYDRSHILPFL
jgi:hypothetical protein